jgi:hypothetical protein
VTNAMILEIFSPEKMEIKLAILAQNTVKKLT